MERLDPTAHRDAAQVPPAEQGGSELNLGHHHLHALVGIAEGDRAADLQARPACLHLERPRLQSQWGGRTQAVAQFQPEQGQPQQQGQHQQEFQREKGHGRGSQIATGQEPLERKCAVGFSFAP